MLHAHAWLKLNCVPQKIVSFHPLVSRHVSRPAQYTQHCATLFHFLLLLLSPAQVQGLITTRIHCADSRDLRGDGFTDPEPRTLVLLLLLALVLALVTSTIPALRLKALCVPRPQSIPRACRRSPPYFRG